MLLMRWLLGIDGRKRATGCRLTIRHSSQSWEGSELLLLSVWQINQLCKEEKMIGCILPILSVLEGSKLQT